MNAFNGFAPLGAIQLAMVEAHSKILDLATSVISTGEELAPFMIMLSPDVTQPDGLRRSFFDATPAFAERDLDARDHQLWMALRVTRASAYVLASESYVTTHNRIEALSVYGASVHGDRLFAVYRITGKRTRRRLDVRNPMQTVLNRTSSHPSPDTLHIFGRLAELLD